MTEQRKGEKDLARYFQEHKDDPEEWSDQAVEAEVARPPSIVYSVRFSSDELAELRRAAKTRRVTLSELVRTSAVEHVRESRDLQVHAAAPSAYRAFVSLIVSQNRPRRVETTGGIAIPTGTSTTPSTV